jgi:hypothetical protein
MRHLAVQFLKADEILTAPQLVTPRTFRLFTDVKIGFLLWNLTCNCHTPGGRGHYLPYLASPTHSELVGLLLCVFNKHGNLPVISIFMLFYCFCCVKGLLFNTFVLSSTPLLCETAWCKEKCVKTSAPCSALLGIAQLLLFGG